MSKFSAQVAIDFIDNILKVEIPAIQRLDERDRSKAHFFELGPRGKQFAVIVGNFNHLTGGFDVQQTRVLLESLPPEMDDVEQLPVDNYYNGGSAKRSTSRLAPPTQRSVIVTSEAGLGQLLRWYSSTTAFQSAAVSMYSPIQSMKDVPMQSVPTNTILYGPPGTGKTYATTSKAVHLCDGFLPEGGDQALRERFEELRQEGRVSFVTFHQSYGYEEFVEGLRPVAKSGQVVYEVLPGAFKRACITARLRSQISPGLTGKPLKQRTLFKMSLGANWSTKGITIFDYCIQNNCILLGWGKDIDFTECTDKEDISNKLKIDAPGIEKPASHANFIDRFKHNIQVGDIVIVSLGNKFFRAVAEVTGIYEYAEDAPFQQMRAVRWLAIFKGGLPASELYERNVVMPSLYELNPEAIRYEKLEALLAEQTETQAEQPHVLIIDEINRANISKVFGELITLIEPDKREGGANAVTLKLPYSGEDFSVPANLHLMGTMNTADRSIALLDTALRRRFEFEEVMPKPELLGNQVIEGINLGQMLQAINERIEVLYDRDHTVGHAYLMGVETLEELDRAFRFKVLPLLQEYFYENLSQVRRVLGDLGEGDFVRRSVRAPIPADGDEEAHDEPVVLYSVNQAPFPPQAFKRIYEKNM